LIVLFIDLQDPKARAIVDGRVLIISLTGILDPMPRHWLLVSLPTLLVSFITLVDRKPAHLELFKDTPDAGVTDVDIVVAFEIDHDFPGSKMVVLPQIDDFRQYAGIRCPGDMERATGTV
jgi:hypothetical protein